MLDLDIPLLDPANETGALRFRNTDGHKDFTMTKYSRTWISLGVLLLCMCSSDGEIPSDMSMSDGNPSGMTKPCGSCGVDQVCLDGTCQSVRLACPCPRENYCDLSTSLCKAGCTEDAYCNPGQICDPATSMCRIGCRTDANCGVGEICDPTTKLCRDGCRVDASCGSNMYCDSALLSCQKYFQTEQRTTGLSSPGFVTAGDLNNDRRPEFVTILNPGGKVGVLLNTSR